MIRTTRLSLILLAASVPAFADCTYPRAPAKIPDGSTAPLEEMVTAKKAVEQYNKDMDAYLTCIKGEYDAAVAAQAATLTEEQKKQKAVMHAQKESAAVEELTRVANRFNDQVRAYKVAHPSK
jgi:hypothetical protein